MGELALDDIRPKSGLVQDVLANARKPCTVARL
jgi:hypothetical protein